MTATPKHDRSTGYKRGMNNTDVFGGVLESTAAPELISSGSIVPPVVVPYETDEIRTKENAPMLDALTTSSASLIVLMMTSLRKF